MMFKNHLSDAGFLLVLLAFGGVLMFAMVSCEDIRQRSECKKMHDLSGLDTKYPDELNFDQGCYVRLKSGQWIPAKNWRGE